MAHLSSFGLKVVKRRILFYYYCSLLAAQHNCRAVMCTPGYCSKILLHNESYMLSPQSVVTLATTVCMHDE